jgi:2-polyprenyl-3-methyl-5-hydroxy-6-metoxy-1,4-benzoquinol methylase
VPNCRFCNTLLEQVVVDLGETPLANSFLSKKMLNEKEEFFPLKVLVCKKCHLVQLEEVETPQNIFTNYAYFSSYSKSFLDHAKNYVSMMIDRFHIDNDNFVVEIASNDGYLLQFFKEKNIPLLGIEPAENIARIAKEKEINTINEFFGKELAEKLIKKHKKADLIICNNVIAHVPKINDFVSGLKILMSENGIITIEFPHLMELVDHNQWDTIYHEHFSYFSFFVMQKILEKNQLKIFDVEKIPTHGGSLRVFCTHSENKIIKIQESVHNLLKLEKEKGMMEVSYYQNFSKKIIDVINQFTEFCDNVKNEGKTIVGYGAPAKANTFLNCCRIKQDIFEYVVDLSPHKQGLYLPGSHIHIKSPDEIKKSKPDYVVIFPWNLKEEIMSQIQYIKNWGGKFVIPIPKLQIIEQ